MKKTTIILPILLLAGILLFQCKSKSREIAPNVNDSGQVYRPGQVDKDGIAIKIMDTLSDQLRGRWNLARVELDIRPDAPVGSIKTDTTFLDFGTLHIRTISRDKDLRYPLCTGEISFGDRTWPIAFTLAAGSERIFQNKGPQAITLLNWHFPTGSYVWQPEEVFFRDLSIVGDNYTIQLNPDGSMTWKGLNRHVKEILFRKNI